MTGRVKDHYWNEISGEHPDEGHEPDDLEMLAMDAERARGRYLEALNKHTAKERAAS
jgi:hypothetical protein